MSDWQTLDRPGNLGPKRDSKYEEWNAGYGVGNWRLAWHVGSIWIDLAGVCCLYEDAYFFFFLNHNEVFEQLLHEASDVYDDAVSNVDSGFDYTKQETKLTHLQDIAIRRCALRFGRWFEGNELVQIRGNGKYTLSKILSPSRMPFHRPDLIERPELEGWWQPGSIDSFYQSNRYLQIRSELTV